LNQALEVVLVGHMTVLN